MSTDLTDSVGPAMALPTASSVSEQGCDQGGALMATVIADMSMSLDGYIADRNDDVSRASPDISRVGQGYQILLAVSVQVRT